MILRLIGLRFGAAALVMGLSFGWSWPLGAVLGRVNAGGLAAFQDMVQRSVGQWAWDALFGPVLAMPAWGAPAAICLLLFLTSAMRPGRG